MNPNCGRKVEQFFQLIFLISYGYEKYNIRSGVFLEWSRESGGTRAAQNMIKDQSDVCRLEKYPQIDHHTMPVFLKKK